MKQPICKGCGFFLILVDNGTATLPCPMCFTRNNDEYGIVEPLPLTIKRCHVCNDNNFWHYPKDGSIECQFCDCFVDPDQHYNPETLPTDMEFIRHPRQSDMDMLQIRTKALEAFIKYSKGEEWQL